LTESAASKLIGQTTSLAASRVRRNLIAILPEKLLRMRGRQEFFTPIRFRSACARAVVALGAERHSHVADVSPLFRERMTAE